MAHGDKRWITTYDGRIKRSTDRTKKDYYGELRWWEPYLRSGRIRGKSYQTRSFCPQCKHNHKPFKERNDAIRKVKQEIRNEWNAMLQKEVARWKEQLQRWRVDDADYPLYKPESKLMKVYDYVNSQKHRLPGIEVDDERAWLCYKCRVKFDKKQSMWYDNMPGRHENETWMRRAEYAKYRASIKSLMQKAKYDDDYYDQIGGNKHGWLD